MKWPRHCSLCQLVVEPDGSGLCPHCIGGVYAETDAGQLIMCDACGATGRVPPVTEFESLAAAVVTDSNEVDVTAALVLADYLDERDDSRGVRLRRRVKLFAKRLAYWTGCMDLARQSDYIASVGRLDQHLEYLATRLRWECEGFISYFFRLTSVGWGDPLPRERRGQSYVIVEPGVKHAAAAQGGSS